MNFTSKEQILADQIKKFKRDSGTHSPSNLTLLQYIPELSIKIDACFLSNPYATDLFLTYFEEEIIKAGKFRDLIEFYPSQNKVIARPLAQHLNINVDNIFIGNGAIEIIQAVLHQFVEGKTLLTIPTFSSYYEFAKPGIEIIYNHLNKEDNFRLNVEGFINKAIAEEAKSVIIINPNNPDGGYTSKTAIIHICESLKHLDNIIIDESFIHFAFEDDEYYIMSVANLINTYPNLVVIKSMSKDFGIAGLRAGYGVMAAEKVRKLLKNGYLWNSSGLAEYFFNLYVREDFNLDYETVRKEYIKTTTQFLLKLKKIPDLIVYPSKANFALVELKNDITSEEVYIKLLTAYGINVRDCNDKIGLDGEFLRIASRKDDENKVILNAFKEILKRKFSSTEIK